MGVNAEDLVDHAIKLKCIGGTYGGLRKPTKFLCLLLKQLQIQPEKEIIYAFIENNNYKYVRALGIFYLRLTGKVEEIYLTLEQILVDMRKLYVRNHDGKFEAKYMDEFVDDLINEELYMDVVLPRLTKREILEDEGKLEERVSPLEEELDDDELNQLEEKSADNESNDKPNNEDEGMIDDGQPDDDDSNNKQSKEIVEEKDSRKEKKKKKKDKAEKKSRRHKKDKKKSRRREGSSDGSDDENHRRKKWRKLVSKKKNKRDYSRSRSRSRSRSPDVGKQANNNNNKKLDKNSDEYWLELRKQIGV